MAVLPDLSSPVALVGQRGSWSQFWRRVSHGDGSIGSDLSAVCVDVGLALCLGVSATATCHSYPSRASWALLTKVLARVAQRIVSGTQASAVWSSFPCLCSLRFHRDGGLESPFPGFELSRLLGFGVLVLHLQGHAEVSWVVFIGFVVMELRFLLLDGTIKAVSSQCRGVPLDFPRQN
ncbi:hypothetical protein Bca101_031406 [Brassica carinata]